MKKSRSLEQFKLYPELVPKSLQRKSLSRSKSVLWKYIQSRTRVVSNYVCVICGVDVSGPRESLCHEVWSYDDILHVQTLKDFQCICQSCNAIKHFGHFRIMLATERISAVEFNRVVKHALQVNNCTEKEFNFLVSNSLVVWEERSRFEWTQDLSIVRRFKEERQTVLVYMKSHPNLLGELKCEQT